MKSICIRCVNGMMAWEREWEINRTCPGSMEAMENCMRNIYST
jgi:hypothetical protein